MGKVVQFGELKNIRHESNLIELQGWQSGLKSITLPMITALGEKDIPGSQMILGFAYIDKPEDGIGGAPPPHPHRDQWVFLFGAREFTEFHAGVEFFLGGQFRKINYPFYAYIPKGMSHEPLKVLRVGKPLIFIDARFGNGKWPIVFTDGKPHQLE
jgi:hypothetical protein